MPTPHGARGGMAFSADELRVLRRALAQALQSSIPARIPTRASEDVQEYLRLAEAVEEALRESGRLRTFLFAELARYRSALPGSAPGYLERLRGALESGYVPESDDLAALRRLRALPCGGAEERRRTAMLHRCERIAELAVRVRLDRRAPAPAAAPVLSRAAVLLAGARPRLLALTGGRRAAGRPRRRPQPGPERGSGPGSEPEAERRPEGKPAARPAAKPGGKPEARPAAKPGGKPGTAPGRRVPTPAEIWPPHRRPAPFRDAPDAPKPSETSDTPDATENRLAPPPPTERRRGA